MQNDGPANVELGGTSAAHICKWCRNLNCGAPRPDEDSQQEPTKGTGKGDGTKGNPPKITRNVRLLKDWVGSNPWNSIAGTADDADEPSQRNKEPLQSTADKPQHGQNPNGTVHDAQMLAPLLMQVGPVAAMPFEQVHTFSTS